jgi:hypothetical protein
MYNQCRPPQNEYILFNEQNNCAWKPLEKMPKNCEIQITWLCNGDFVKEDDRKKSRLEPRQGELNKWTATLTIMVRHPLFFFLAHTS